jgi:hypothetical protein
MRPQDIKEHRHYALLQDIAKAIEAAPSAIHIYKVKSHIGIVGNERADEIATAVAKGESVPCWTHIEPSNYRREQYWLYYQPKNGVTQQGQDNADTHPKPVECLQRSLQKVAETQHRLGLANTQSVYFQATLRAQPKVEAQLSNAYLTSTQVTPQEVRNVIKLRTGGLYTSKLAKRYGHRQDDLCPLCGQPDGGYHAVSGCPGVQKPVTQRHHRAGRLIKRAIMASRSAEQLVMADVGSTAANQADDLHPTKHRIPLHVVPTNMPVEVKRSMAAEHVPDLMLHTPGSGSKPARYTLLEIKYCRDTDPDPQTQAAVAQHAHLVQAIKQYDPKADIRTVPLVLGVAGYIYKNTTYALQCHLGLPRHQVKSLARKLHIHAVKSLTTIINYRRKREPQEPKSHKRKHQAAPQAYNWKRRKKKRS